jgi:hypothetical protein
MRRKRGTIRHWWSSPVRLFFGEILSQSILALFPDKFLMEQQTLLNRAIENLGHYADTF